MPSTCALPCLEAAVPAGSSSPEAEAEMAGSLYQYLAIRAVRIARDSGKKIGDFQLTAEVAQQMDADQTGVLIANCETPQKIHEKTLALSETEYPGPWVVVLSTIDLARWWYAEQQGTSTRAVHAGSAASRFWRRGNCWFVQLEVLQALSEHPEFSGSIAGIILVDPQFQTQFARGWKDSTWTRNDRPELVNHVRKELQQDGIQPSLMFMACPPAVSLNTLPAQRAYCLESLSYCDGSRLRVGPIT